MLFPFLNKEAVIIDEIQIDVMNINENYGTYTGDFHTSSTLNNMIPIKKQEILAGCFFQTHINDILILNHGIKLWSLTSVSNDINSHGNFQIDFSTYIYKSKYEKIGIHIKFNKK